jgi:hypothetical protein
MMQVFYAGAEWRVDPTLLEEAWSLSRREQYLLRPEIRRPLALDPNVWPRAGAEQPVPLPWVSVDEVMRQGEELARDGNCLIVLGAVAEDEREAAELRRESGVDARLDVDAGWTALGFDIVDEPGFISGLCNCGYRAELPDLRAAWAARLNEHGLFVSGADALAFRELTDVRVPEHAPFRVVGIWLARASRA